MLIYKNRKNRCGGPFHLKLGCKLTKKRAYVTLWREKLRYFRIKNKLRMSIRFIDSAVTR
jgi:hypothetical protein